MALPLELPVFKAASAQKAARLGASRIELNRDGSYPDGGLTPSVSELGGLADLQIPVRVMIRPRGPPPSPAPDFIYSDAELQAMRDAITTFKESGLLKAERGDGFVFGILRDERHPATDGVAAAAGRLAVDTAQCKPLVDLAKPYACVFHRAFDDAVGGGGRHDQSASALCGTALDDVVACGFHGILTSGGPGNAPDNAETLKEIIEKAEGRIEIVVGGGVRGSNVKRLAETTGAAGTGGRVWFHSSCLTARTGKDDIDPEEVSALLQELS